MFICPGKVHPLRVASTVLCIVSFSIAPKIWSQSSPVTTPAPVATNKLGQFDSAALSEILEHLKIVGVAPWSGMQGTGTITYGADQTPYNASLSVVEDTKFRLDGQTPTGSMSVRIHGRSGKIQAPDGKIYILSPESAALGALQFELPRMEDLKTRSSALDHGLVTIDGASLHRVTIERPLIERPLISARKNLAVDFYFDPSTHLLVKTVTAIQLDGARNNLLQIITYGDYRQVNGVMIPFHISRVLDGQKQWTIQLSEATLNPSLQSTYFDF